jgi:hypothetical protein
VFILSPQPPLITRWGFFCPVVEEVMLRNLALVVGYAVVLACVTTAPVPAAQFGTPEEAKAMLERASTHTMASSRFR